MDEGLFGQRLREARRRAGLATAAAPETPDRQRPPEMSREPHPLTFAVRLGVEMVAALGVACAIGYGLDRLFGTRPWIMVAFVPLGVAAGVRGLLRSAAPRVRPGMK